MRSEIVLNGLKVFYHRVCETNQSKMTVLFLHGWGGSSSSWETNISELKKHFDCIYIDLPGFGISDTPESIWGVAEYAEFINSFVNALGIHKFSLVGKSFGGRVSLYYANKWPKTLSGLILVASAGVEGSGIWTTMKVYIAMLGKLVIKKVFPTLEASVRQIFYYSTGVNRDESDYKWELKKIVTRTDLSEIARNINVPTLIVWGEYDNILPKEVGRKLHRLIKESQFKLIKGSHNAHRESAEEFNSIVQDFLSHL